VASIHVLAHLGVESIFDCGDGLVTTASTTEVYIWQAMREPVAPRAQPPCRRGTVLPSSVGLSRLVVVMALTNLTSAG